MSRREARTGCWIRFPDSLPRAVWFAAGMGICAWLLGWGISPDLVSEADVSLYPVGLSHDFPLESLPLADFNPDEDGGMDDLVFPARGEATRHEEPGSRDCPAREPVMLHPAPHWKYPAKKTHRTGSPPLYPTVFFHRKPASFLDWAEWGTDKSLDNKAKHPSFQVRRLLALYLRLFAAPLPRSAFEPPFLADTPAF